MQPISQVSTSAQAPVKPDRTNSALWSDIHSSAMMQYLLLPTLSWMIVCSTLLLLVLTGTLFALQGALDTTQLLPLYASILVLLIFELGAYLLTLRSQPGWALGLLFVAVLPVSAATIFVAPPLHGSASIVPMFLALIAMPHVRRPLLIAMLITGSGFYLGASFVAMSYLDTRVTNEIMAYTRTSAGLSLMILLIGYFWHVYRWTRRTLKTEQDALALAHSTQRALEFEVSERKVIGLQLSEQLTANERLLAEVRESEQKLDQRVQERTAELQRALDENIKLRIKAVQAAAAAERSRLARELHDSVSQAVFSIALAARTMQHLQTTSPGNPARFTDPLEHILSLSDAALTEMRALLFELRPESLEAEGILAALKKQAAALHARHGVNVRLMLPDEEPDLTLDGKEAMYRIALESLHNVVKYARATVVYVELTVLPGCVDLRIADDGVGFDVVKVPPGHFGLKTMRERIAGLNGEIEILSEPGKGTSIWIRLPQGALMKTDELLRTPERVAV
jgi:signal transduction histidine kinase